MRDLKECPFCNGEATIVENHSDYKQIYFRFVRCSICGAQTRATKSTKNEIDEQEYSTISNLWNKRAE